MVVPNIVHLWLRKSTLQQHKPSTNLKKPFKIIIGFVLVFPQIVDFDLIHDLTISLANPITEKIPLFKDLI